MALYQSEMNCTDASSESPTHHSCSQGSEDIGKQLNTHLTSSAYYTPAKPQPVSG
ncbi:hypothetical protein H6G80_05975 [Nostoc sp. FACHB-87]|uniref:hypothetical protein n=1 Tax=Nostocaceae TaxID=1162 RepID=UPI00168992EC|nr:MULTISPECIES: hypothetical protein [Nostocaceae]MBD2453623.1 hypothetical protein [Nostoc sp. FACHB-87]MBD2475423.1 hypothetical protein [Anabaena sp. FACHB-83]